MDGTTETGKESNCKEFYVNLDRLSAPGPTPVLFHIFDISDYTTKSRDDIDTYLLNWPHLIKVAILPCYP